MSTLTTHVLDTSRGVPAAGVAIAVTVRDPDGTWRPLGTGVTDGDGRCKTLLPAGYGLPAAVYRLDFDVAAYFAALGVAAFFPSVSITFEVRDEGKHHHVPLLLSPFGYSTYRGS
jgi:5-hydroxyisourate hydrolase